MCKFGIEEYMDGVNWVNEMTKKKGLITAKRLRTLGKQEYCRHV